MKQAGPIIRTIPAGDDRERLVCGDCGFVLYDNPKIIVGAVCTWQDRYLLVRRAIEPRLGFWTMPIGYMELGETTEQGALREVWEEACARAEITGLLSVFSIPEISQVHMIYRAE
ncbi:MAG: NUDIX domain-containing protein, partial [Magnetospirillum sp.]